MTSFTRTLNEGGGGYVLSGYVGTGYVVATQLATDSLDRTYASTRTITPTVTLSDAIKLGIVRFITTQAQTITDALTRRIVAIREFGAGTAGYTATGYVSSGYLTDSLTSISDSISKVRDTPRSISEGQVTLSSAIKLGIVRFIGTQTVTASDTIGRTYAALRTASETWSNSFSVARALVATRVITQTVTLTHFLVAFKGIAGEGARRVIEATTYFVKRSGIANLFKRSGTTST